MTKTWLFLVAIILSLAFFAWNKNLQNTILVAIWLFWWFLGWRVQLIFALALIVFILVPVTSLLEIPTWSQNLAIWSFFLIIIAVFLQIWEYFHLSQIAHKFIHFHKKEVVNFQDFQDFSQLEIADNSQSQNANSSSNLKNYVQNIPQKKFLDSSSKQNSDSQKTTFSYFAAQKSINSFNDITSNNLNSQNTQTELSQSNNFTSLKVPKISPETLQKPTVGQIKQGDFADFPTFQIDSSQTTYFSNTKPQKNQNSNPNLTFLENNSKVPIPPKITSKFLFQSSQNRAKFQSSPVLEDEDFSNSTSANPDAKSLNFANFQEANLKNNPNNNSLKKNFTFEGLDPNFNSINFPENYNQKIFKKTSKFNQNPKNKNPIILNSAKINSKNLVKKTVLKKVESGSQSKLNLDNSQNKNFLFPMWANLKIDLAILCLVFLCNWLLAFGFFRFGNNLIFRDFVGFSAKVDFKVLSSSSWLTIFWQFINSKFGSTVFWNGFFQATFTLMGVSAFWVCRQFTQHFSQNNYPKQTNQTQFPSQFEKQNLVQKSNPNYSKNNSSSVFAGQNTSRQNNQNSQSFPSSFNLDLSKNSETINNLTNNSSSDPNFTNVPIIPKKSINFARLWHTFLCFLVGVLYAYNPWTLERFVMGQTMVLVAQICLLPCIWQLFCFCQSLNFEPNLLLPSLEKSEFVKRQRKVIFWQFLKLLICWLFLTFINVHQGFLFGILFLVVNFCQFISQIIQKPLSFYQEEVSKISWISLIFAHLILPILLILSNVLLVLVSFGGSTGFNLENKNEIIRSFSPHFLENQNGLVRILLGSGSWMTATFVEIFALDNGSSVQKSLENWNWNFSIFGYKLNWNLANLSFYFNFWLGLVTILVIFALVWLIFRRIFSFSKALTLSKNREFWSISIFLTLVISLILNFGYTYLEFINQVFYAFPFSLIMRESGKFYALVLAILAIILTQNITESDLENWQITKKLANIIETGKTPNSKQKSRNFWQFNFNFWRILLIILIVLSSLLAFIPLAKSLNYVQLPQILETTNQKCRQNSQNGKLLLLPYNLYIKPTWSRTFVPTPSGFYFECEVIVPSFTQVLDGATGEKTILQQNTQDLQINELLERFENEPNPNIAAEKLLENLQKNQIKWLLVDENDPQTNKFWIKFRTRTNQISMQVIQSEQNMTLWQIN